LSVSTGVSAKMEASLGKALFSPTITFILPAMPAAERKAGHSKPGANWGSEEGAIGLYWALRSRCCTFVQLASATRVSNATAASAARSGSGQPARASRRAA
jgi:hypothetical protein